MVKRVIIADIDGCCIDPTRRLHNLPHDLEQYHAEWVLDKPINQGVVVYRKFLSDPDFDFFFVTARDESARDYTIKQLRHWVDPLIRDHQLLMRPLGLEQYPDHKLKPLLLKAAGFDPEDIFLVFEDRKVIVDMWRSKGVVVYQTAEGDW